MEAWNHYRFLSPNSQFGTLSLLANLSILQVNLPRTTPGDKLIVAPQQSSMLISTPHSVTEYPSDIATSPSMVEEIEGLFQCNA